MDQIISRNDLNPTTGHRVCSLHFSGGLKTYLNDFQLFFRKPQNLLKLKFIQLKKQELGSLLLELRNAWNQADCFLLENEIDNDTTPTNLLNKLMTPLLMPPKERKSSLLWTMKCLNFYVQIRNRGWKISSWKLKMNKCTVAGRWNEILARNKNVS